MVKLAHSQYPQPHSTQTSAKKPKFKRPAFGSGIILWERVRHICPVTIMVKDNKVFLEMAKRGVVKKWGRPKTLWIKLFGPFDTSKEFAEVVKKRGIFVDLYANQADMQFETIKALNRLQSLGDAFTASVDLYDLKRNPEGVFDALIRQDMSSLRKACPRPDDYTFDPPSAPNIRLIERV